MPRGAGAMLQVRHVGAVLLAYLTFIATAALAAEPHGRAYLFRGMIETLSIGGWTNSLSASTALA